MDKLIPNRILNTTEEERQLLRDDPVAYQVFIKEEQEKVSDPETGFIYFLQNYGSHLPASGGAPDNLTLWAYQPKIARYLNSGDDTIILKARRIGATLIVCHYMIWVAGLREDTPGARCIAISKNQRDADELLATCRMIADNLPDYIRPAIGTEAKDSQGRVGKETTRLFSFPTRDGATIRSLPASSNAARSYTATLLFLDELAFHPNAEETWVSARPVTEGGGQIIIASTGNGLTGDGRHFSYLWEQAEGDPDILRPLFIAWHEREDRTQEWYNEVLKTMPSVEKMAQEYPADPSEAFAGNAERLAFSNTGYAEELGRKYDQMLEDGELPEATEEGVFIGLDWGLNSAAAIIYPLAGHGFYIADELVSSTDDAETFSRNAIELANKYSKIGKTETTRVYYDAAGAQQIKSMQRIAPPNIRTTAIPFGKYKTRTVEYIRMLFKRTKQEEAIGYIAISSRCKETLRQLKSIQQNEDGKLVKGDDHSADALIAGLANAGVQWDKEHRAS